MEPLPPGSFAMVDAPLLPDDPYDQHLRSLVAPSDWVNPVPTGRYNLVVVGGGPAGLVAAAGAAGLGARVALIERRLLGGDCLNYGCVPSKALLKASRVAAEVRDAAPFGVLGAEQVRVDFGAVMRRVRERRATLAANDSAARFRSLGVDVFLGDGRFVGPHAIEVAGQRLEFARACIATGSRPALPDIPGLTDVDFRTNETFFLQTELPRRLMVLGGGPVGCELAQALARCGTQVTLLGRAARLLHQEEEEASRIVTDTLRRDGVNVQTDCQVEQIDAAARCAVVRTRSGTTHLFEFDQLLVAVGRSPNVEGLDLEAAQVAYDPVAGVQVNDFLRTTNKHIYAAGDVCTRERFTHAADAMARIVLRNALFFGRSRFSKLLIPRCTYTSPEVARVGQTRYELEQQFPGRPVTTIAIPLNTVDRFRLDAATEAAETSGLLRVHLRPGTDRIVGATLVAPHAAPLLATLTLAIREQIGLARLAELIHPYPSESEVLKRAADEFQRTRLTPSLRRVFEWLMRWRRG